MRTKNPLESTDVEELTSIGVYWMNKCYALYFEKRTMEVLLKEHSIDPPLNEFFARMTSIQTEEMRRWEEATAAIKEITEERLEVC